MKKIIKGEKIKKIFKIKNTRARLLLLVTAIMIVSLLIMAIVNYIFFDNVIQKNVNRNAASIGADYSSRIYGFLNRMIVYVNNVAVDTDSIDVNDKAELIAILAEALHRNDNFTEINYIDMYGNMIRADGLETKVNKDYYQKWVQGKRISIITDSVRSRESDRMFLEIISPIVKNGQMTGIIQGIMPVDSLMSIIGDIKFMNHGYGYIIDESGLLIAHELRSSLNGRINVFAPSKSEKAAFRSIDTRLVVLLKKALTSDKPIYGQYNVDGTDVFTVITPMDLPEGSRWLMAISAPDSEVAEIISRHNMTLLFTGICCMAGGILIVFLISNIFVETEEKYFKTFQKVTDVVGLIDNKTKNVFEVNDAFYKVFGYTEDETIGKKIDFFWQDPDKTTENIIAEQEVCWQAKDGSKRTGILSADTIKIGKKTYEVFVWHDITEKKKNELKLQQAYDLLEKKVEERTQDYYAANQELTAMNEEMIAINEELGQSNKQLHQENHIRKQAENKLLRREKQYRATTNLLIKTADANDNLPEIVLFNALQLVEAQDGFIGRYENEGQYFILHCGLGIYEDKFNYKLDVRDGPLQKIYELGNVISKIDNEQYGVLFTEVKRAVESVILVPFKKSGKVKGLLAVTWSNKKNILSEDIEILRQFADLAFLAMEKAQIQNQIEKIAFNDALTGLPNRINLNMYLAEELEKAEQGDASGIVFSVDIDEFKTVNDTFGHNAGDKVIIQTGQLLQEFFGVNTFVSRISSDEFIIVKRGEYGQEDMDDIATALSQKLRHKYDVENGQTTQLAASIGIAIYPSQGNNVEEILKKADAAMYAAKTAGGSCWRFFMPELLEKTTEDTIMINNLHRALEENEFFLQYQPQFTADGSKLAGFEALIRWKSQKYGLVSPGKFIPLAERSWLINKIGEWVLAEGCRFAQKLAQLGHEEIKVAINISPRQIKMNNFVDNVRQIIDAAHVFAPQIEIEVTESMIMENLDANIPKLETLQKDGMNLALDDFGTGFSSLTYLRTLPVNYLKIDKSFIDKIAISETQVKLVATIIELGHALGMKIVAEGVEAEEQLVKIQECGCDYVQGYVFGKPLSEEAAVALCKQYDK